MSPGRLPISSWADEALSAWQAQGLLRHLEPLSSAQGPVVVLDGREFINLSSNDYLGLANDEGLQRAFQEGLSRYGVGSGASRLVVGNSTAHESLEKSLATFTGAEAVRLFNSGYAANVGILSTVVGAGDVIFSDEKNHASIIDGCRLSKAQTVVYPHRDMKALRALLDKTPARRRLLVTDAVFSMDGTLAPLREWVELAKEFEAGTLLDEAHAVGLYGKRGSGLAEEWGLSDAVDIRVGTLGKSVGTYGAYAASSKAVCDWLLNRARSLVFSTSIPPALCVATEYALGAIQARTGLRQQLFENIQFFAQGLSALGISSKPESAVFPWVLGENDKAVAMSKKLRDEGILAKAIRPPTVPKGHACIRFALSAAHSKVQLEKVLSVIEQNLK